MCLSLLCFLLKINISDICGAHYRCGTENRNSSDQIKEVHVSSGQISSDQASSFQISSGKGKKYLAGYGLGDWLEKPECR